MRRVALGCAVVLAACSGSGDHAADTATGDTTLAPAAPPATVSLADMAGTWDGRSTQGDSVVATWRVVSTADTTGWTITFPEGEPLPIRILGVAGDSVVSEFGPFESPVTGQQVTVRSVGRLQGRDHQVGTYQTRSTTGPDSVRTGRWEAARVP